MGIDSFRTELTSNFLIHALLPSLYRVYQNNWSGLEVDYIHRYGEETYKYY